jgi:hypothetical protein
MYIYTYKDIYVNILSRRDLGWALQLILYYLYTTIPSWHTYNKYSISEKNRSDE